MKEIPLEQLADILSIVGPTVLTVTGTILSAVVAAASWAVQKAWAAHSRKMALMAEAIERLANAVQANQKSQEVGDLHLREQIGVFKSEVAISLGGIKSEVAGAGHRLDFAAKSVAGVEAICRSQQEQLSKTNESLALASGRLDAVFRYVDASVRATDASSRRV